MSNKARNTAGKFAPKSEAPRKVRSVNLTDDAWQWLAATAEKAGMSRNDYLEALAEGNQPFMETANTESLPIMETVSSDKIETIEQPESDVFPIMETVSHALTTPEEAKKHAQIYGFTPEEALADAHFQISMLESNYDELEDRHEAAKREIAQLRSQLETERADRGEIEAQLSDLKQNSPSARDLPEAADLLNRLKAKRKKSTASLADIEAILEMMEE
ncbi:hypothetical protein IQ269_26450 [Tychonema sp. LEGE 07199]|uniref:hypothetical protein n=1 Tax=unclassified Tychonema TaxID=2642144 RepID=UPI0018812B7A|nr:MULTISPECIES: hypothetical protein [unclassified Tychonema]MBE9124242.1 hypothetical protein [Tychonema sp. LEGE 07199]MBE9135409.1 hypothetical protein [Tychonema sp. LEGE 07196]